MTTIPYLKIKIISLADEARRIRAEEKRHPGGSDTRNGLYLHRINDVRKEARSALLAYGFLRGRTYTQIEPKSYTEPNWKRIATLVQKYGNASDGQRLKAWAEVKLKLPNQGETHDQA